MLRRISQIGTMGVVGACLTMLLAGVNGTPASASSEVLYVGTFGGVSTPAGQTYTTIQRAVNAAKPGDWILVAPGDYHESDDAGITKSNSYTGDGWYGGVVIDTSDLHVRGMNRNSVIVDGDAVKSDDTGVPCSPNADDQNTLHGLGRNGIVVWKANDVSISNLTVCNFQAGTGDSGNEIWWNGGDGSGKIGIDIYAGSYLTATNTYFTETDASVNKSFCDVCALYGIFSSNSSGGSWNQIYANNFADSGAYIGACQDVCDATIDNAWFEDNALGYSGTNSGGALLIEHSKFDNNKEGLDTNTALTGDPPPPQNGECLDNKATSTSVRIPGTSVNSCWVFEDNQVFDNNNANVPVQGTAGLGLTGGGQTVSGGRNDAVVDNEYYGNDAWGIVFAPYPDANTSSDGKTCTGTGGVIATGLGISGVACLYSPEGDYLGDNKFSGNAEGFGDGFGPNKSNADYGNLVVSGDEPTNCFAGNTEWNSTFTTETGAATDANVEDGYAHQTPAACGTNTTATSEIRGPNTDETLLIQAECASGVLGSGDCILAHAKYPVASDVVIEPLPGVTTNSGFTGTAALEDPSATSLPTMPNPCSGAPTNLWCPDGRPA